MSGPQQEWPRPAWQDPAAPSDPPFAPYDPPHHDPPHHDRRRHDPAPVDPLPHESRPPAPAPPVPPAPGRLARRGLLAVVGLTAVGVVAGIAHHTHDGPGADDDPATSVSGPQRRDLELGEGTTHLSVSSPSVDVQLRGTVEPPSGYVSWSGSVAPAPFTVSEDGTEASLVVTSGANEAVIAVPAAVRIDLGTSTADVIGSALVTRRLSVRSGSGTVDLTFAEPPEQLTIHAGGGDVRLRLPPAGYAFDVAAPHNHHEVPPSTGSRPIVVRAGSGDVLITVW